MTATFYQAEQLSPFLINLSNEKVKLNRTFYIGCLGPKNEFHDCTNSYLAHTHSISQARKA